MAAEERKPLHLEGTVEHVMYCNAENGYTVLELDAGGTAYTYTWKLWNPAGTSVIKTYTGKSITVSKADVTGKGVLMCEVSK